MRHCGLNVWEEDRVGEWHEPRCSVDMTCVCVCVLFFFFLSLLVFPQRGTKGKFFGLYILARGLRFLYFLSFHIFLPFFFSPPPFRRCTSSLFFALATVHSLFPQSASLNFLFSRQPRRTQTNKQTGRKEKKKEKEPLVHLQTTSMRVFWQTSPRINALRKRKNFFPDNASYHTCLRPPHFSALLFSPPFPPEIPLSRWITSYGRDQHRPIFMEKNRWAREKPQTFLGLASFDQWKRQFRLPHRPHKLSKRIPPLLPSEEALRMTKKKIIIIKRYGVLNKKLKKKGYNIDCWRKSQPPHVNRECH